jgi:hypothetical protein
MLVHLPHQVLLITNIACRTSKKNLDYFSDFVRLRRKFRKGNPYPHDHNNELDDNDLDNDYNEDNDYNDNNELDDNDDNDHDNGNHNESGDDICNLDSGKVTVTNSESGKRSFRKTKTSIRKLHGDFRVLLYPCDQFQDDEPEEAHTLKRWFHKNVDEGEGEEEA